MEYCILGSSGIRISRIIKGTWQTGKAQWVGIEDSEGIGAIRAALEAGITTFDTADFYGRGHAERILGETLAGVRNDVVLATKVYPVNLAYDKVMASCHRSLKNLKTDFIDLYQIHWPSGSFGTRKVPIEETMRAMGDLKDQGKIRSIGVSNFSQPQMEEAEQYGLIDSLQPPYNLFWRHVEDDAMPYCVEKGIPILAYSPMAQGLLTGKFGPGHSFPKGDHRASNRLFRPDNFERVQAALTQLRPIAERNNITLGQLALAWVLAHPRTCTVAGARNAEQISQSARAVYVHLSASALEEMDTIGRTVTDHLDNNPIQWAH